MKILVIPPDKPQEMTVKYRDFVGDNKTRIVRKTIRPSPHYLGR
ncbi:MAG: hypothetical protein U9Q07_07435 [Planctomycetota bacterium]|nr:hypothetical protein [Planctomycetota bacterium]